MADYKQEPVFFVNAEEKRAKSSNRPYVWSKTIDLDEVKRELGTQYCTVKCVQKNNPKKDTDRTLIFSPSQRRFVGNSNPENNRQPEENNNGSDSTSNKKYPDVIV